METESLKTIEEMVGSLDSEFPEYFQPDEFAKCTPQCSINDMSSFFMYRLNVARHIAGVPFVLNSAFRSVEWEKRHSRSGSSSHCKGCAVDIRCFNDRDRYRILYGAICAGFRRIGIGRSFVHLDSDSDKPDSIWFYG